MILTVQKSDTLFPICLHPSTETTLLQVISDIVSAVDGGSVTSTWSLGSKCCLRHCGSYRLLGSAADRIWCRRWCARMDQNVPCGPHPAGAVYESAIIHQSTGYRRSTGFGSRLSHFPAVHCRVFENINRKGLVAHS